MPTTLENVDERTRRATRVVGAFGALVGLGALAGWVLGSQVLIRVLPTFPPLRVTTALGILGAAIGLDALGTNRRVVLSAGALLAIAIGVGTLIEYEWNLSLFPLRPVLEASEFVDLGPGRMAIASGLSLTLIGLALLALRMERWPQVGTAVGGTLAAIVAILSITILFTYSTDVLGGLRANYITGIAVQAAAVFAAMGICLVLIAWYRDPGVDLIPAWVTVAVGLSALVTTLIIWRSLRLVERERAVTLLNEYAAVAQRELMSEIEANVRPVRQLGAMSSRQPRESRIRLDSSAGALLRNAPALTAFGWMDSGPVVRSLFNVGASAAPDVAALQAAVNDERQALASAVRGTAPIIRVTPVGAPGTELPALLVIAPLCDRAPCGEAGVAVLRPDLLLRPALAIALPGYEVTVHANRTPIYGVRSPTGTGAGGWSGRAAFTAYGVRWHVAARPSAAMLPLFTSDLPKVVAGLGVIVSVLLATTARLVQKRVASARQAERRRLARALEGAADGLWEVDLSTGETTRSPALLRRLGFDPSTMEPSMTTARWDELVHPDERKRVAEWFAQLLAGTATALEIEYRVRAADGEWHAIVERGRVVERDMMGRPSRVLGISADVSERKRAEQVIADSERRFRAVFEGGFHFKNLLDLECHLLEANRTALEFAGVDRETVCGIPLWETPWWRENTSAQERLRRACSEVQQGQMVRYEEELRGHGEARALVDLSIKPITDSAGRVVQILAEARDITDVKRAQDAMREMDTLSTMGRVAARVAHEINNPLAGIQNSFLLIKDAVPPTHRYHEYVGAIEREISRIAAVTRQLYETYRPDSDDGKAEAAVVVVISDAVRMLEQVNRASQVSIAVDTSQSPAVVPIPGALLRQAVYNLVQNAVEASPPGETVHVRAWREGDTFWLSVRDRGPGVPVGLREWVFEPFVSTKGGVKTSGMGLGLSLVRKSVQALGGRIEIHDPEGGGAEFRIRLPIAGQTPRSVGWQADAS
ncbi:MAG TPA: ATP-binding protein [Gemmatimonadales bacterium]|nr:ATP-binding protein [Gemmatimonadales bacterium]